MSGMDSDYWGKTTDTPLPPPPPQLKRSIFILVIKDGFADNIYSYGSDYINYNGHFNDGD